MGIKIYTYTDPYDIQRESYWNEIKDYAHFCVSQTMVNGMECVCPYSKNNGYLTTVKILIDALYCDWENNNTRVKQIMEVDNVLNNITIDKEDFKIIKSSLEYNTKSIVKCLRLFKELGLNCNSFDISKISVEQKYLLEIYKEIDKRKNSYFDFKRVNSEAEIDSAIMDALKSKHKDALYKDISLNAVVIHGIHQFSPAMLCAIEDISKYKDVYLLFNYQGQYKAIYQTWINIYSLFDSKMIYSTNFEFRPISLFSSSFPGNTLADSIGTIANGDLSKIRDSANVLNKIEVIEYENLTEFAGHCAAVFENAKRNQKFSGNNKKAPIISYMSEQLYSTSNRVNDILRAYFPQQFGERHFLDYPIGHFFVSVMEMWDYENQLVKVENMANIKECLNSGIIKEEKSGQLIYIFNTIEYYVCKNNTLLGIIKCLNDLKKYVNPSKENLKRIGYLNISKVELDLLVNALIELNEIIKSLFKDFSDGGDNFNRFYSRVKDIIVKRSSDIDSFDEKMKDTISRLLNRLNDIDLPDTGSFSCLKQTMSFYLSQDESVGRSANWIVRDFEQIDGDILRSKDQNPTETCYHFCCLSDKDICSAKDERLPWPLDINFFDYSYEPLDTKYQIFLKAKMEFKNFKKYALLYGLEFNRVGCKLSYIKNENRSENEIYHILKMLGIKTKKCHSDFDNNQIPFNSEEQNNSIVYNFDEIDKYRYAVCPYKFALESCIQGKTLYRDRFVVTCYLKVLLANEMIKEKNEGPSINDKELREILIEKYNDIDDSFHISNEYEKTQIISDVYEYVNKYKNRLGMYNKDFLYMNLNSKEFNEKLNNVALSEITKSKMVKFEAKPFKSQMCRYCASKDICLK